MNTMTPAQVAARLRILADLLDVTTGPPVPLRLYVSLDVSKHSTTLDQDSRVAAVTAVADALGMTAEPVKANGGWWEHIATEHGDSYTVRVHTDITGPQVCACGVACTHGGALAAAA
ncbi:hypothetical protein GCM10009557_26850 [Virgisporangium ochraceum]|uniref:Uncharacterized protein n=1 Tax=Virgisporangium ochraceum TaxID=65505 RepID=A0A8J4E8V2_9ACTN|nr:hypothetical protein [Virgisporangium ochraceum]GIJ65638.1 hypothetical protein Voc01_005550 [Virgisporangium ochraceum]